MEKSEFLKNVEKNFKKYGLSRKTLSEISDSLEPSDITDTTEDQVTEICTAFEPVLRVFQSETDARVTSAVSRAKEGLAPDPEKEKREPETPATGDAATAAILQKLMDKIDNLEKGQSVSSNNSKVAAHLKDLKLSEKEIESVMFGREFNSQEQIDQFVEKQTELYDQISKDRVEAGAGNGFLPKGPAGNYSKASIAKDIEEFNKQN